MQNPSTASNSDFIASPFGNQAPFYLIKCEVYIRLDNSLYFRLIDSNERNFSNFVFSTNWRNVSRSFPWFTFKFLLNKTYLIHLGSLMHK